MIHTHSQRPGNQVCVQSHDRSARTRPTRLLASFWQTPERHLPSSLPVRARALYHGAVSPYLWFGWYMSVIFTHVTDLSLSTAFNIRHRGSPSLHQTLSQLGLAVKCEVWLCSWCMSCSFAVDCRRVTPQGWSSVYRRVALCTPQEGSSVYTSSYCSSSVDSVHTLGEDESLLSTVCLRFTDLHRPSKSRTGNLGITCFPSQQTWWWVLVWNAASVPGTGASCVWEVFPGISRVHGLQHALWRMSLVHVAWFYGGHA